MQVYTYGIMNENNIEPQATGGSKNKLWYIIGGIVVLLVLGSQLSGFFARRGIENAIEQATGVDVDYGRDGTATYKTDEGSVTVGGNSLPDNWPADAPKYPGANIQYSGSSNPQTGEAGVSVVFQTKASAQSVTDFYKKELASNGWKIESTATMGPATTLAAKKGDKTFAVYIVDSGEGMVNVTIGISGV
jgi:hypothetical protein